MDHKFIPYQQKEIREDQQFERVEAFFDLMDKRRSIRDFSDKPIDLKVIKKIVQTASTAPSGAHKQPWVFCVVSNPKIKKEIRIAAEEEEFENYNGRMSERWMKDLEKFGTTWKKPFLETAPYLIVVFRKVYEKKGGEKHNYYYVNESVGIATGMLLTAIHNAGLVALTHTPSPMNFLKKILNRPENERPFLLIPVGYPSEDASVPEIKRKATDKIMVHYD